jgi:AcrR family transcriptional regulator
MIGFMPRVSEEHLAARREQILSAAARCFARNGFHDTSMQDVIGEAGLSVGAVYRYFKSKDELRNAVAAENVGALMSELAGIADHEPPLPVADAMTRIVDMLDARLTAPDNIARIAIQAWSGALFDPDLNEFIQEVIRGMRRQFIRIARRAQQAGHLPADADPDAIGSALLSIAPGYVVQRTLTGSPDAATLAAGLRALLP